MTKKAFSRSIIVAVDFGTTFSGIAWAQTGNPDVHYIVNQWPQSFSDSLEGMTSDKVPSDIAYEQGETGSRCLWGFQIPESMPCIQWIKLGLAPDQKLGISSRLPPGYQDHHNAHPPYVSSTEDVVTDYLRSLREHTVKVLETKIGRAFAEIPLEFIITVPAVWPDKAKAATLSCAAKAGLGESSMIRIISEPEAAAIHSLHISNPHGLGVGDTVILCDAGGGTVDLITFSVVELEPTLRLKEAASGNGALCGSTFLNKRFECFLEKRLASSPGWGRDTLEEALHRFENVAKRSFSGNIDDEFYFPVPGIRDNAKARVRRGRLQVTGQEMKDLFLPIPQEIHDLVQGQMRTSRRKVKAIFLVGGFGQNPYLRNFLRGAFSPGTDVIAPVNGWTAVVRGALMKVLGEICYPEPTFLVESRVARKHYGIRVQESFIKGFHDEKRKFWDPYHGEYKINVMKWFIKKGDTIREGRPIIADLHNVKKVAYGNMSAVPVTFYELDAPLGEPAPLYFNENIKESAYIYAPLNRIEQEHIPVFVGYDGADYFDIVFSIHASYFSAHCEYILWYKRANHGSAKVDYV